MDPLLHWLQYPNLLPQSDPMKQYILLTDFRCSTIFYFDCRRALELYLPMLEPMPTFNNHATSTSNVNNHRDSYAIKRRHMTFAEAEKERAQRMLQVALLSTGDVIGLEPYVCDLATYVNSARCTASCDLFYILKHNFARLQKRHAPAQMTANLYFITNFTCVLVFRSSVT